MWRSYFSHFLRSIPSFPGGSEMLGACGVAVGLFVAVTLLVGESFVDDMVLQRANAVERMVARVTTAQDQSDPPQIVMVAIDTAVLRRFDSKGAYHRFLAWLTHELAIEAKVVGLSVVVAPALFREDDSEVPFPVWQKLLAPRIVLAGHSESVRRLDSFEDLPEMIGPDPRLFLSIPSSMGPTNVGDTSSFEISPADGRIRTVRFVREGIDLDGARTWLPAFPLLVRACARGKGPACGETLAKDLDDCLGSVNGLISRRLSDHCEGSLTGFMPGLLTSSVRLRFRDKPKGSLPVYVSTECFDPSAEETCNLSRLKELVTDKIVLIGEVAARSPDRYETPLDSGIFLLDWQLHFGPTVTAISGVELHATAISNLLYHDWLLHAEAFESWMSLFLILAPSLILILRIVWYRREPFEKRWSLLIWGYWLVGTLVLLGSAMVLLAFSPYYFSPSKLSACLLLGCGLGYWVKRARASYLNVLPGTAVSIEEDTYAKLDQLVDRLSDGLGNEPIAGHTTGAGAGVSKADAISDDHPYKRNSPAAGGEQNL